MARRNRCKIEAADPDADLLEIDAAPAKPAAAISAAAIKTSKSSEIELPETAAPSARLRLLPSQRIAAVPPSTIYQRSRKRSCSAPEPRAEQVSKWQTAQCSRKSCGTSRRLHRASASDRICAIIQFWRRNAEPSRRVGTRRFCIGVVAAVVVAAVAYSVGHNFRVIRIRAHRLPSPVLVAPAAPNRNRPSLQPLNHRPQQNPFRLRLPLPTERGRTNLNQIRRPMAKASQEIRRKMPTRLRPKT